MSHIALISGVHFVHIQMLIQRQHHGVDSGQDTYALHRVYLDTLLSAGMAIQPFSCYAAMDGDTRAYSIDCEHRIQLNHV